MNDTKSLRTGAGYALGVGLYATHNAMTEAADTIDALRDENERLEADVKEMREAMIDATAHLVGAASAYEKYAKRFGEIKPKAVIDPFFETRHMDFHKAASRAQAYLNKQVKT